MTGRNRPDARRPVRAGCASANLPMSAKRLVPPCRRGRRRPPSSGGAEARREAAAHAEAAPASFMAARADYMPRLQLLARQRGKASRRRCCSSASRCRRHDAERDHRGGRRHGRGCPNRGSFEAMRLRADGAPRDDVSADSEQVSDPGPLDEQTRCAHAEPTAAGVRCACWRMRGR